MDVLRKLEGALVGIDNISLDPAKLNTLELLLRRLYGHNFEAEIYQRFRSRKNIVIHLGVRFKNQEKPVNLVAKLFVTGYFENEIAVLRKCHEGGLPVPPVNAAENGVILMDYIPGETLTEQVNRTFDPRIIDNLANWYYKFHKIAGVVKEDPRLRNFICNENILFGLDFEEAHEGINFQIVDPAITPEVKTIPRRRRIVAMSAISSFIFAIFVIYLIEWVRKIKELHFRRSGKLGFSE